MFLRQDTGKEEDIQLTPNHASPERCLKSFTMIFLGDHDNRFKFWQSDSI